MPTLLTNISTTPQLLPPAYGGAAVAAGAQASVADTPANVAAAFGAAGLPLSGTWVLTAQALPAPPVPPALTVYASATGNPLVNGTDPNNPTTLATVMAMGSAAFKVTAVLAPGTYALPAVTTHQLAAGANVVLQGSWKDSGLGPRTVASASTAKLINDLAAGLTINAWEGYRLRFTSGALAGQTVMIRSNTAAAFVPFLSFTGAPANGDTYVVETQAVVFQFPASFAKWLVDLSADARLAWDAIALTWLGSNTASFLAVHGGIQQFTGCLFNVGAAQGTVIFEGAQLYLGQNAGSYYEGAVTQARPLGVAFVASAANAILEVNQSRFFGQNVLCDNCPLQTVSSVGLLAGFDARGALGQSILFDVGSAVSILCPSDFASSSLVAGVGLVVDNGSVLLTQSGLDVSSAPADGVTVRRRSVLKANALTSAVNNTGFGVRLLAGSSLQNQASNTITGASGAVQIGGAAAATAWASITATVTTDASAAAPQFCTAST